MRLLLATQPKLVTPVLLVVHRAITRFLHQARDDLVQQRPQRFIAGCGHFDIDRLNVSVPVHAVQHQTEPVLSNECGGWRLRALLDAVGRNHG